MSALGKSTSPITSGASRGVDDDKIVGGDGAQAHSVSGIGLLGPVPVVAGAMQKASFVQALANRREIDVAELFVRRDGQLERGAFQMVDENFQIVGLHKSVLRRAAEKIIRMLHDKLIQGAEDATRTAHEPPPRRPARPARCQVEAIVPG